MLSNPVNNREAPPPPLPLFVGLSLTPTSPIVDFNMFMDTGMNSGAFYRRAIPKLEALGTTITFFDEPVAVEVHNGETNSHIGFCSPVLVTHGSNVIAWEFAIIEDDGGETSTFEGCAGRQLIDHLGVFMAGLSPNPASAIPTTVDHDADSIENLTMPHPEQARILDGIAAAYEANGKVKGFCNLPSATVHIKPLKTPRYIRQYPIPIKHEQFLAEKAEELLAAGTIEEAPHDSPYNLPLTVARKKDSITGLKSKQRLCIDPRELNDCLGPDVDAQN